MSSSSEKAVGEIQQEETVKKQGIIKTHLLDWKHSIIRKPDRPVNIWHLLTNLNNKQRITFTAGKEIRASFVILIHSSLA
jgi:hypothetical protein